MNSEISSMDVYLEIAKESELDRFKKDLQEAFRISAEKEFGHKLDEPIPSDSDIEESFRCQGAVIYHVLLKDKIVGGAIISINEETQHNKLLLFFVNTGCHDKGVGTTAWRAIEKKHPKTKLWETATPYFEKRNIHFYINKCGFKIVEYYNKYHPDPNQTVSTITNEEDDDMFRFEKSMDQ